ncbi:aminoglycoside phosphotransferase family protein [Streptomyces sp. NBC_01803]|uniref:aminoglycoside phosphotransferase family protein n=1 Tax=Streptomyces sp. NBC_01803 TaxID=2975946 RepID=UPI002DD9FE15|nr:aminoglycoside phosphotransferase family protein [Streptomyces sp. NBC_01803]WSA44872.1 aminoglycoside phosphotransferase family protein [Streptomyces sp. NBC_01803]
MSQPLPALRGHHRIWQVLRAEGELASLGRLKVGRPRPGAHRFDPRCFDNEEDLLIELALLGVERIAPVYRVGPGDIRVHGYIEGEPLSVPRPPGTALTDSELDELTAMFGRLATVSPAALALMHRCPVGLRPRTGRDFLRGLVRFTRRRVYAVHRPALGGLFAALRVDPAVLAPTGPLAREAALLTDRPFCLLHADLHRDNLIVAESDGGLCVIDWELALIGDPVYDLATHLHLMRYPPEQEREVLARWARAVDESLPGAAAGLSRDLPRYLAYKRVQSVFTDVIRQAYQVRSTPSAELPAQLARTGEVVSTVLGRAAHVLGLRRVPGPRAVEAVYAAFSAAPIPATRARSAAPAPPSAAPSPAAPAATRRAGPSAALPRGRSGGG